MTDVTLLAAFGGGLVSFLSPCVLPIVPGYLSVITGVDIGVADEREGQAWRITRTTSLFVAGFGAVFVLLGLTATSVGSALADNQVALTRMSGLLMLSMGLFLLGSLVLDAPWLYQEKRFHPQLERFGPFASPVAGAAFGLGWTPCIGPVLTSVLAVAAADGDAGRGVILLSAYSLGLGVPFLITGLAFGRMAGAFGWVKRHFRGLMVVSASSLAVYGTLLALNRLNWVTSQLQDGLRAIGLNGLVELG
jgi:cytochrome c-type biogenesis protein